MSKIINELAGQSDDSSKNIKKPQQLDLLDVIPISIKTPPAVTAPVPPRAVATRPKSSPPPPQAPPVSPSPSINDQKSPEHDMKTTQELESQCESLRMEITALSASLDAERRQRHALETELESLTASAAMAPEEKEDRVEEEEVLREQFRHYEQTSSSQMAQIQAALEEARESVEQEQAARAQERLRIQTLESELAELRSALEEARQSRESTLAEAMSLREELDHLQAFHRQSLDELATAQNALSTREQQWNENLSLHMEKVNLLTQEREQALETAQRAERQRHQDIARFEEREKRWHIRLQNAHKPVASASQRLPFHALKTLPVPVAALTILIIIACGASFMLGKWQGQGRLFAARHHSASVASPSTPARSVAIPDIPAADEPLPPTVASLPPAPVASVPKTAALVLPTVSLPGLRVQSIGKSGLTLIFDYGLFIHRTELSDRAKRDLAAVAKQVAASLGPLTLEIEGHTDASPVTSSGPFDNNQTLGLKRAEAVREYLVSSCHIPPTVLTTTSAGDAHPPFPNTSPDSRRKNRTVVLKLGPSP